MCMYLHVSLCQCVAWVELSRKHCLHISACTCCICICMQLFTIECVCMHDVSLLLVTCGSVVFLLVCCCSFFWELVRLSVVACFFLLHGSVLAAVLSEPPAGVWLASNCLLFWSAPPVCAAFMLHLHALFRVCCCCLLPGNGGGNNCTHWMGHSVGPSAFNKSDLFWN